MALSIDQLSGVIMTTAGCMTYQLIAVFIGGLVQQWFGLTEFVASVSQWAVCTPDAHSLCEHAAVMLTPTQGVRS